MQPSFRIERHPTRDEFNVYKRRGRVWRLAATVMDAEDAIAFCAADAASQLAFTVGLYEEALEEQPRSRETVSAIRNTMGRQAAVARAHIAAACEQTRGCGEPEPNVHIVAEEPL